MFICTTDGGDTLAFPNVCNTPSPSGTIPIPYASLGAYSDASDTSSKVTIDNKDTCTTACSISSTSTDEAGSSGGVISGSNSDEAAPLMGSMKVYIEGDPAVRFLDPVQSNGSSANSYGACISPSQTKVLCLG